MTTTTQAETALWSEMQAASQAAQAANMAYQWASKHYEPLETLAELKTAMLARYAEAKDVDLRLAAFLNGQP